MLISKKYQERIINFIVKLYQSMSGSWCFFERLIWMIFFLSVVYLLSYNWYDDFFDRLDEQKNPYEMLQIWVQADKLDGQLSPIGGSAKEFARWSAQVEHFLSQAAYRQQKYFTFHLIADRQTIAMHQNILHRWEKDYASYFKCSSLESLLQGHQHEDFLRGYCSCGIAASCSDFIRIFFLNKKETTSIYLDVDTFMHRLSHQRKPFAEFDPLALNSSTAFGLSQGGSGILIGLAQNIQPHSCEMYLNNDCLVSKPENTIWPLIEAAASQNISRYKSYLDLLNSRSRIVEDHDYDLNLSQRVAWAKEHPDLNVNISTLVVELAGPTFWSRFFNEQVISGYVLPDLPSQGAWMNKGDSVRDIVSFDRLRGVFGSGSESILSFILSIADYKYYQRKQSPLAQHIRCRLEHQWSDMQQKDKDNLSGFISFIDKWIGPLDEKSL